MGLRLVGTNRRQMVTYQRSNAETIPILCKKKDRSDL
jgi:hypothetical protein